MGQALSFNTKWCLHKPRGGPISRCMSDEAPENQPQIAPPMIELGLPGPKGSTRIVVAMSGGVDSSVVAALLHEAGYDVVGVTLQLYDHGDSMPTGRTCCAGQDIYDARTVADRIGFPHYVLDYESKFRQSVMDEFADSYLQGETPIPCVRCNERVKFRDLLDTAKDLGAAALATGHYVQRQDGPEGPELLCGVDPDKDQSYFLFSTSRQQLEFLRFPLGGMSKHETRAHAHRFGLAIAEKPDSQDICFVPNGRYQDVVAKLRPGAIEPGEIVDLSGQVLGQHDGVIGFTVGQRKGLNIGGHTDPYYVLRLDPVAKRVIVGPRDALACAEAQLREVNWLGDWPLDGARVHVKLRSAAKLVPAVLEADDSGSETAVTAHLYTPQFGVSPGQACVFYDGARVLGGGWIKAAPTAAHSVGDAGNNTI